MRKLTVLVGLLFPVLALAAPVVQVCDQSGNCAPISSTNGIASDVKTLPVTQTLPVAWVPYGATRFSCGVVGQAATLLECAALAAGRAYVITDIIAGSSTTTAGTFAVQSGTGTNCGTNTTQVFPPPPMTTAARYVTPASTAVPFTYSPWTPLYVTTAHAVCVIGVATNTANVIIAGWYYTP